MKTLKELIEEQAEQWCRAEGYSRLRNRAFTKGAEYGLQLGFEQAVKYLMGFDDEYYLQCGEYFARVAKEEGKRLGILK